MDFHLKQWRDQQQQQGESEPTEPEHQQEQSSASSDTVNAAKIPKLLLESSPYYPQSSSFSSTAPAGPATATLPLFVPEGGGERQQQQQQRQQEQGEQEAAHPFTKFTSLTSSLFPSSDHHSVPCRFPRNNGDSNNYSNMGSYFSWAQWQELELQALIYRYMMAGATVPPELLHPIKKSLLLHSSPYFLHSHFPAAQYHPSAALLHSGYWGRAAMDPEPGRCRRTDGKKWRCSRDVVAGQKYCERHMHRGRNRSRKPVEIPTAVAVAAAASATGTSPGGIFKTASSITVADATTLSAVAGGGGSHFSIAGSSPSSIDLFHLDQSYSSEVKAESKGGLFGGPNREDSRTDGHILRHFFDDWPRPLQESDNTGGTANSSTCLSISDVSLKLSTGNVDEPSRDSDRDQPPMSTSWAAGWGSNQVASMGGPLAEALRSSSTTAQSSPTSVLQQLPRGPATEVSFISN